MRPSRNVSGTWGLRGWPCHLHSPLSLPPFLISSRPAFWRMAGDYSNVGNKTRKITSKNEEYHRCGLFFSISTFSEKKPKLLVFFFSIFLSNRFPPRESQTAESALSTKAKAVWRTDTIWLPFVRLHEYNECRQMFRD